MWIVELEPGVWLAEGEGDPPRTLNIQNAHIFEFVTQAHRAMVTARTFRDFQHARVCRA